MYSQVNSYLGLSLIVKEKNNENKTLADFGNHSGSGSGVSTYCLCRASTCPGTSTRTAINIQRVLLFSMFLLLLTMFA